MSWSWRGGIVVVIWQSILLLTLTSQSSAWVIYSNRCRRSTTTLMLDSSFGQESDGLVLGRRLMIALLPSSIAMTSCCIPTTVEAKCKPSNELLDARMQLDLAVQASQSWNDAEEIANDPLLDEVNLLRALRSCQDTSSSSSSSRGDQVTSTVLESVKKMRSIIAKEGKTAEEAMTFMKYGTSARTAVDSYINMECE